MGRNRIKKNKSGMHTVELVDDVTLLEDYDWEMVELDEMLPEEAIASFHKFSPEFEARMEALFAEARRREAARTEAGLPVLVPPSTTDGEVEWKYLGEQEPEAVKGDAAGAEVLPAENMAEAVTEVDMAGVMVNDEVMSELSEEAALALLKKAEEEEAEAEAAATAADDMAKTMPEENVIPLEPEPETEDKPAAREGSRCMPRALRNGLIGVASVLVVLGIGAVQSLETGAVFGIQMEVFREFYDDFVSVTWGSNEKETRGIEVVEPGYLPEGAVEASRVVTDSRYKIVYMLPNNGEIMVSGDLLASGIIEQIDSDKVVEGEELLLNGIVCVVKEVGEEHYIASWEGSEQVYNIVAKVEKDEFIKIVASMQH